jgi:hypothetical protein
LKFSVVVFPILTCANLFACYVSCYLEAVVFSCIGPATLVGLCFFFNFFFMVNLLCYRLLFVDIGNVLSKTYSWFVHDL